MFVIKEILGFINISNKFKQRGKNKEKQNRLLKRLSAIVQAKRRLREHFSRRVNLKTRLQIKSLSKLEIQLPLRLLVQKTAITPLP